MLEEKLALSQAAYQDTKFNLESSDSKLAESTTIIEDLRIEINTLKASSEEAKLAEKDAKIKELKDEIVQLKQTNEEEPSDLVTRLKFICQKLEKEKKKISDDFQKKCDELIQGKIKLEENLSRVVSEKQKILEKEKTLMGLFVSVKGMIDRTNPEVFKQPDVEAGAVPKRPASDQPTSKPKENILWVCDKCTFQSRSESVVNEHIIVDHQGKQKATVYLCDICNITCNSQIAFKTHMQTHHGDQTTKSCNVCDYKSKTEEDLIVHSRKHNRPDTFHCDRCGHKTNSIRDLDNHINDHHAAQESFPCIFCKFICSNSSSLEKHLNFRHRIFSEGEELSQATKDTNVQNSRQKENRGSYSDDERRRNGFCRLWNNNVCTFEFCKFLHENSPLCRYQESCRNPSNCRFFHKKPHIPQKSYQYREEDFPPFQSRKHQEERRQ